MPEAAIAALTTYFISLGSTAVVAAFWAKAFVYVASAYLLNRASEALTPKRRSHGLGGGNLANYFDAGPG